MFLTLRVKGPRPFIHPTIWACSHTSYTGDNLRETLALRRGTSTLHGFWCSPRIESGLFPFTQYARSQSPKGVASGGLLNMELNLLELYTRSKLLILKKVRSNHVESFRSSTRLDHTLIFLEMHLWDLRNTNSPSWTRSLSSRDKGKTIGSSITGPVWMFNQPPNLSHYLLV